MLRPLVSVAIAAGLCLTGGEARAQGTPGFPIDTTLAGRYFREAADAAARDAGRLWGRSLAGPILFIDPTTRTLLAEEPDSAGLLRALGGYYSAPLPAAENPANMAIRLGGRTWAMVLWPPPSDSTERGILFAHELWHRIQSGLGFRLADPVNQHLATRDGRLWLRLEARALRRALAASGAARAGALRDALAFRRSRQNRFPGSDSTERQLELSEGLAEFTGVAIAAPAPEARRALVAGRLAVIDTAAHFERSFAYQTGPAYGFFLDALAPGWRGALTSADDLAGLLDQAVGGKRARPASLIGRAEIYGYARVRREEDARAAKRRVHLASLRRRFISGPVLQLPFAQMKVGFDPRQVEALDSLGSVYGALRLTDRWGVLQCDASGGLIRGDWSGAVVPAPSDTAGRRLTGPGWVLELNPGWRLVPGPRRGDWTVTREP